MNECVKVFFPIKTPSTDGVTGEWLWAKPMDGHRYLVDNSPFDLYDISAGDVVVAKELNAVLTFKSVAYRGGHSTYRIRLPKHFVHEDFLKIWPAFEAQKCTYEGASGERRLYSIDVPPETDVFAVYDLLELGEKDGNFEFEEAHFCKPQDKN
jgi:Domain of unknown function (DUF4265)